MEKVTTLAVAVVVATVTMFLFVTNLEIIYVIEGNGLCNDRCDGSSSKNECNGEFDLNHF
jgi:hypothetical protein